MLSVAALVLVTMALKDTLYTCCTAFVAKGRAGLASGFDTAGDIASVLTYGVGGVEAIKHGLSVYTLVVFAAMAAGSYAGTFAGMGLTRWVERRFHVKTYRATSRPRTGKEHI